MVFPVYEFLQLHFVMLAYLCGAHHTADTRGATDTPRTHTHTHTHAHTHTHMSILNFEEAALSTGLYGGLRGPSAAGLTNQVQPDSHT